MMNWTYNGEEITTPPNDAAGFVYLITRLRDGKKYIGKKTFWTAVTKPPLKGKIRKRRSKKESDWKSYWGSNAELQEAVKSEGESGFTRIILRLCKTKSEMSYYESRELFLREVLLSDDYFNGWIVSKISRNQLPKT